MNYLNPRGLGCNSNPEWHFWKLSFLTMDCKAYSYNIIVTCNIWCMLSQIIFLLSSNNGKRGLSEDLKLTLVRSKFGFFFRIFYNPRWRKMQQDISRFLFYFLFFEFAIFVSSSSREFAFFPR